MSYKGKIAFVILSLAVIATIFPITMAENFYKDLRENIALPKSLDLEQATIDDLEK